MKTTHDFYELNSRDLSDINDNEADLVITSPPYPMVDMWDDIFSQMNGDIKDAIDEERGYDAFELMHQELDEVWEELDRVTTEDSIICINIGDATRKEGDFHLFHNHSRIIDKFTDMGYGTLPSVLWRKPTNSAAKFMGSGMIPPNAYVTLEHEHILIFRKTGTRKITGTQKDKRYESAYFWEERNDWFSDVWTDIVGEAQAIDNETRERAGSYPIEIPYRIINMYSIQGDTVLDPFVGTGTTSVAAAMSGRNSIGVDIQSDFIETSKDRMESVVKEKSVDVRDKRIESHKEFLQSSGKDPNYESENYDFGVITKQEKRIKFPIVEDVEKDGDRFVLKHDY